VLTRYSIQFTFLTQWPLERTQCCVAQPTLLAALAVHMTRFVELCLVEPYLAAACAHVPTADSWFLSSSTSKELHGIPVAYSAIVYVAALL
jgi:hypothetical protein